VPEPSQTNQPTPMDQATYWNENGGEKWVKNLDHIDVMIGVFNSHLLAAAAPVPGEYVLDVGCGGGTTTAALAMAVQGQGKVLGVDISKVILDAARQRQNGVENVSFELGDAATYNFDPGCFDVMTSRFGVMFFEQPDRAFQNLRTALKPGGRIAFVCWRALTENPWMAAPAAAAFEILPRPEPQDPNAPGPFAFADAERLTGLLQSAGFDNIHIEPVDELLDLGSMENALGFFTKMGPAAAALQDADEDQRGAALDAMVTVLNGYLSSGSVRMPGAVWLVTANSP
jgi:SAM-dependent methyltransferase